MRIGKLNIVTDTAVQQHFDHAALSALAIAGGADLIIFRQSDGTTREIIQEARRARDVCRRKGVTFLVDARVDIALAVDADGTYLRREDFPIEQARMILGPHRIIGGMAHTLEEAREVVNEGGDFVALGLVYSGVGGPGSGASLDTSPLVELAKTSSIPILGFGGVRANNLEAVLRAGASGVLVRSAISTSHEPETATRELRTIIDSFTDA